MNDNAKKWVAALRSGKYKQASKALRVDHNFCCLGVACDLSGRGEWKEGGDDAIYRYVINGNDRGTASHLPPEVMDWLGVRDHFGRMTCFTGPPSLSVGNDEGLTFAEIADLIESEPAGLFVEDAA